jgi:hypothetical protein
LPCQRLRPRLTYPGGYIRIRGIGSQWGWIMDAIAVVVMIGLFLALAVLNVRGGGGGG